MKRHRDSVMLNDDERKKVKEIREFYKRSSKGDTIRYCIEVVHEHMLSQKKVTLVSKRRG